MPDIVENPSLSPWLQEAGFIEDPFSHPVAENQPPEMRQETYIFDDNLEQLMRENKSVAFMAPYGGGKTAARFHTQFLWETRRNVLIIVYDQFETVAGRLPRADLQSHSDDLFGAIAESVRKPFFEMSSWEESVTLEQCWWWRFLDTYLIEDSIQFQVADRPLTQKAYEDCLSRSFKLFSDNASLTSRLQTICKRLTGLGFNEMLIVMDGVDGQEWSTRDNMEALLRPLLFTLPLFGDQITWKIFLPEELSAFVRNSSACRKYRVYATDIEWNPTKLIELLKSRIEWASDDSLHSLAALSREVPDLDIQLADLTWANRSQGSVPRGLLRFGSLLVAEQEVGQLISRKSWLGFQQKHLSAPMTVRRNLALDADDIQINRRKLRESINSHFDMSELQSLIFDLDIDSDDYKRLEKIEAIIKLIEYCERHNLYQKLVVLVCEKRPALSWCQKIDGVGEAPPNDGKRKEGVMNAEKTSELTLYKSRYNPDHFVNRKEELQSLAKRVKQGQLGFNIRGPLYNLWGMQGIGKTWLLHEFERLYRYGGAESKTIDAPKSTCAVYYDFEEEENQTITAVAQAIAQAVLDQLRGDLLTEQDREHFESAAENGSSESLTSGLRGMIDRYLPVLLLDTTETLSSEFWQELEEVLLEPLIASNKIIVVIAGRRAAPRWKRAEVRRRAAPIADGHVTPLDEDALEELFSLLDWPQPQRLAKLVHVYTGGNPFLAVKIGRTLFEEGKLAGFDLTDSAMREPGLKILKEYEDDVFEDLSSALREKLEKLGVLRFYRTEALRYMLSEPDGEQLNDVALLRILRQLDKETEAVWWDDSRNGYVTSPVMRQVLNHRLRLQQPKQFIEKHQKALDLYWDWVDRYPENGAIYLAEICYHQANHDWAGEPLEDLKDFARILQHAESLVVDKRMILPEKIRQDNELKRLLLPDYYENIIEQLETLLNQ